jgi:enoyl-[acyl-carrier protein] reductase III
MAMTVTLSQRTALVTGGSRGIGRGIALKLAEAGVGKIGINYLENDEAAGETARLVRARGAEPLLLKANVGDANQLGRMFATVKQAWDSLDIYVSNARASVSTGFYAPPFAIGLEQWQATLDTQATEFLFACRAVAPMMGKGGRILAVTYAPGSATGSWQPWVAMGAAKAAKESLVRYFAVALAPRGITVNSISPGACDDSVLSGLPPEVFRTIKEWHESGWTPMRRLGLPSDIGNAVALLCSEEAAFITGQLLHVDGGGSAMLPDFPLAIQGAG